MVKVKLKTGSTVNNTETSNGKKNYSDTSNTQSNSTTSEKFLKKSKELSKGTTTNNSNKTYSSNSNQNSKGKETYTNTGSSSTNNTDKSHSSQYTKYQTKNKYSKYLNNYVNNPYQFSMSGAQKRTIDDILNRKDFSYDLNRDALYQQYANQYKALGQQAMADTMGDAATLSGGYGNSYAASAGQQAYNNYLTRLNDIVPQLYQQAYSRYQDQTNNLFNQANLLNTMNEQERANYNADRDFMYNLYTDAVNRSARTINDTQGTSVGNTINKESGTSLNVQNTINSENGRENAYSKQNQKTASNVTATENGKTTQNQNTTSNTTGIENSTSTNSQQQTSSGYNEQLVNPSSGNGSGNGSNGISNATGSEYPVDMTKAEKQKYNAAILGGHEEAQNYLKKHLELMLTSGRKKSSSFTKIIETEKRPKADTAIMCR